MILIHPDAAKRFNELGDQLLKSVATVKKKQINSSTSYNPHPAARVTPEDVIGEIAFTERIRNGLGNEVGQL